MAQNIDLNVRPYYDDFTESSKYYRILFKPGFAVQARELTQLQSGLQNQIEQFGKHLFKNGSKILDANQFFESNLLSLKLEVQYNALDIDVSNFLNKTVIGQTSGCKGIVKEVIEYSGVDNPNKIIIQLTSGSEFVPGEEVWSDEVIPYKGTIKADGVLDAITTAVRYSVTSGIFFINGFFVYTEPQSVLLDTEGNSASYSVGFDIVESFVGADTDTDLLDPANGSSNYAAPGADRLSIELLLTKTSLTNTRPNYIEIARVENGVITFEATRTVYAEIEKELARRTFDESGNYIVNSFDLSIKEHFTNAKGTATISSGAITAIVCDAAGIEFDEVPTITISGDGTGALATAVLDNNSNSNTYKEIISVTIDAGGSGYTEATVSIGGDPSKFMCQLDPGKAYVKGFEFETITPSWIETSKPRTVDIADNIDVTVDYANYIFVEGLNKLFNPNSLYTVDLHKVAKASAAAANKIGTAKVRMVKYVSGTVGSGTETYKVSLFDILMTKKTINSAVFTTDHTTFNVTGHGYVAGQKIVIRGDSNYNGVHTVLASPAVTTDTYAVASEVNLGAAAATATSESLFQDLESIVDPGTTNGANISLLSKIGGDVNADVFLSGNDSNSLIFPLNNTWIKTIRDSANSPQSDYTYQLLFESVSFIAGSATISTPSGLERFFGGTGALTDTIKDTYYIGIVTAVGTSAFSVGDIVRFNTAATRSITLSTPTVGVAQQATFDANLATNFTLNILATVNANTQTEKVKSLQNYTYKIISTPNDVMGLSDSLGIADIKSVKYIYNTASSNPTGQITLNATTGEITSWGTVPSHTDVTNAYQIDNGQRDNIYDHGSILLLNQSTTESTDYLVVVFNYYTHTGSGFLSVDSYSEDYIDIPTYTSPATGVEYNLRDCIDFRPRRADNADTFNSVKFPDADFTFNTDYQYYLPRIDRIFALSEKSFSISKGIPNLNPIPPAVGGDESMLLYTLIIPPYLGNLSDVKVFYHDNRRFTMADIGTIEKRVQKLEYYASLTLLEQQVRETKLLDSNNLEKFKNGFFADPLVGHYIGDIGNYNYRCSIDPEKQELRAMVSTEQLDFDITDTTNTVADSGRITLDYTETPFISQLFASDSISVNPYNIVTYVGEMQMNPPSDSWEESKILPDLVNTINITNHKTKVVSALKQSTVNKVTNVIVSIPSPSDAQKQFLATGLKQGLTAYVYNPSTQTVNGSNGNTITGVNKQVVDNFLGRK
jgi:hypothetical protein